MAETGQTATLAPRSTNPSSLRDLEPKQTHTILYVEDEDLPAEVVIHRLNHDEPGLFHLHRVETLAKAMAWIQEHPRFDGVLLDLNLPDSEGWATFQRVKQRVDGIPIVILTGNTETQFAAQAIEAGAQDFLFKQDLQVRGLLCRTLHHSIYRSRTRRLLEENNHRLQSQHRELERTIANLHQTQLALLESEKIKTIGRLAAGIAHEVKNPLAIISMGVDYLQRAKPEKLALAVERVLPELQTALSRADNIISELLSYAAPRPIHVEDGSLNLIVNEAVQFLRPMVHEASLRLECDLCPTLPDLPLDNQKILQVLINLIANAVHATPAGGWIRVTTRDDELSLEEDDLDNSPSTIPVVLLEIHDSGPGIPPDVLERIFEPFFTTKQQKGGTGLGLSVSRMIMDLHGGRLELVNHPEGGTLARLLFLV